MRLVGTTHHRSSFSTVSVVLPSPPPGIFQRGREEENHPSKFKSIMASNDLPNWFENVPVVALPSAVHASERSLLDNGLDENADASEVPVETHATVRREVPRASVDTWHAACSAFRPRVGSGWAQSVSRGLRLRQEEESLPLPSTLRLPGSQRFSRERQVVRFEPSGPPGDKERSFAELIGVNPGNQKEGWVTTEVWDMPLPPPWTEHQDESGSTYFYNSGTGLSSWEHPKATSVAPFLKFLRSVENHSAEALNAAEAEITWLAGAHELEKTQWQGPFKGASATGQDEDDGSVYFYHSTTGDSRWGNPPADMDASFQITVKLFDIFCGMCREEMRLADVDAQSRLTYSITLIQQRWRGRQVRRRIAAKVKQLRDLAEMRRQRAITDRFLSQHRRLGELLTAVYLGYKQRKLHKLVLKQRSALTHIFPFWEKQLNSANLIQRWWRKYYKVRQRKLRREIIRSFELEYELRHQALALPAPPMQESSLEVPVTEEAAPMFLTELEEDCRNGDEVPAPTTRPSIQKRIQTKAKTQLMDGLKSGKLAEVLRGKEEQSVEKASESQPQSIAAAGEVEEATLEEQEIAAVKIQRHFRQSVREPAPVPVDEIASSEADNVQDYAIVTMLPTYEVEDLGALARDSPMESSIMDPVQQVNAEAELRRIFEMCDVNNTGSIDKRELIKACRKHEEVAKFFGLSTIIRQEDGTRDAMEAFFQSADTNDDREMSWDELKTFYLKQFSTAPAVDMREESTMAIEDQPLFAEDELIDEFREMPVSPRPTRTEEIDEIDEVEVDLKPPLSMTVQAGQIVPASSDGSVSITGRVSSSNTDISSPRFTAGPPPRPEAPQPKRWLGQWDDDGYSSASTPSSDLDSEISDLDTDEEIAALEKEEEAERAKLEKPRRSRQRNSSKGPAKRGQAKRTSQQRPLLATENTSNGRIAPSAPGGPKPVRQSVKKLRSSGTARGISSDRDVPTDEDNDPRSANELQLSARLAALSNPVRAPVNSDGKPSFVRPQHRRTGHEALMQQAKGHQRVLKTAPVLAAVPEQPVRTRYQRSKGPPPGGASAIPLPQLEPKLPPRYEMSKMALGPPRRRLDIG